MAILVVAIIVIVLLSAVVMWPRSDDRFEGIPTIPHGYDVDSGTYIYVSDRVSAISTYYEAWINDVCFEVESNSSCQIALLVINDTGMRDINEFTLRTFQKNEIGQEGRDNGLLLVLVTSTREWRVEVGYGLEGVLPDTRVNDLAQDYLLPYLAVDDYDQGSLFFVAELGWVCVTEYDGEATTPDSGFGWWVWAALGIIVILAILTRGRVFLWVLFLLGGLGRGGGRWGGGRSGGGGARGKF